MRNRIIPTFVVVAAVSALFFSCGTTSVIQAPPIKPPYVPPIPENIMGTGQVKQHDMMAFLRSVNARVDENYVRELSGYYVSEAAAEGVNHDIAFAQMCLETGYLRFGNLVTADMNNFCGLGSLGAEQPGERFPDPRTGVRAHIQHLKAYASTAPLKQSVVDPRYRLVKKGSAPTLAELTGKWAMDPEYHIKIRRILTRMYDYVGESGQGFILER